MKFRLTGEPLVELTATDKRKLKAGTRQRLPKAPKYRGQGKTWKNHKDFLHYMSENFQIPIGTLIDDYVLHHIDGDHNNNDPSNLAIIPKQLHDYLGVEWTSVKRIIGSKFRKIPMEVDGKKGKVTLILYDCDVNTLKEIHPRTNFQKFIDWVKAQF